jgi:ABC-type uncharacterized transport system permease subunit
MPDFIVVALRDCTPILLVALGVLLMHLVGILNIGAEGMMLLGCFAGIVGTHLLKYEWLGVLFAMLIVGLAGLLFAFLTIHLKGNQVVIGVAFNIIAEGLTTTLSRQMYGGGSQSTIRGFKPVFLGLTPLVFIGFLMVFLLSVYLYRTREGLRIRATGENPLAVDTSGLNVYGIQYRTVALGAMVIGLGGCALSMAQLTSFSEGMTTGRGYIALAAVTLGRFTPLGIFLASLVFGFGNALQFRLQAVASAFPPQFIRMIPYVLTVVAVVVSGKNLNEPKSLGRSYSRLK